MAIGSAGLSRCPNPLGVSLSEALFIAGVLTLAVDPFLKQRFLEKQAGTFSTIF